MDQDETLSLPESSGCPALAPNRAAASESPAVLRTPAAGVARLAVRRYTVSQQSVRRPPPSLKWSYVFEAKTLMSLFRVWSAACLLGDCREAPRGARRETDGPMTKPQDEKRKQQMQTQFQPSDVATELIYGAIKDLRAELDLLDDVIEQIEALAEDPPRRIKRRRAMNGAVKNGVS